MVDYACLGCMYVCTYVRPWTMSYMAHRYVHTRTDMAWHHKPIRPRCFSGSIKASLLSSTNYRIIMVRKTWEDSYQELAQCLDETGELPPEHSLHPHVSSLAAWVTEQRRAYHSGRLAAGKKSRLDLLNINILKQPTSRDGGSSGSGTSHTIPRRPSLLDGRFEPPPAVTPATVQHAPLHHQPPAALTPRSSMTSQHRPQDNTNTSNANHNLPRPHQQQQPVREWNSTCIRLAHFVESTCRLPGEGVDRNEDDPEHQLYGWIQTQRAAHHAGRLSHQQIQRLDHIDTRILSPVLLLKEPVERRSQSLSVEKEEEEKEEKYVTLFEVMYLLTVERPRSKASHRMIWDGYGTVLHTEPLMADEANNTYRIQLLHSKSAAWILQELQGSQVSCMILSLPVPHLPKVS